MPSAGDWALERFAAVYLFGTEGVTIDGCTFERLDGNGARAAPPIAAPPARPPTQLHLAGVMVSGFNRNVTISNSDFAYIGGNVREPPAAPLPAPWQLHGLGSSTALAAPRP